MANTVAGSVSNPEKYPATPMFVLCPVKPTAIGPLDSTETFPLSPET
ncbi:hypothetical protein [Polaribacter atrinae]|nr:hypothetical protein [Polaribacter atrinae]